MPYTSPKHNAAPRLGSGKVGACTFPHCMHLYGGCHTGCHRSLEGEGFGEAGADQPGSISIRSYWAARPSPVVSARPALRPLGPLPPHRTLLGSSLRLLSVRHSLVRADDLNAQYSASIASTAVIWRCSRLPSAARAAS